MRKTHGFKYKDTSDKNLCRVAICVIKTIFCFYPRKTEIKFDNLTYKWSVQKFLHDFISLDLTAFFIRNFCSSSPLKTAYTLFFCKKNFIRTPASNLPKHKNKLRTNRSWPFWLNMKILWNTTTRLRNNYKTSRLAAQR